MADVMQAISSHLPTQMAICHKIPDQGIHHIIPFKYEHTASGGDQVGFCLRYIFLSLFNFIDDNGSVLIIKWFKLYLGVNEVK
jgi:hypothetical protein